MSKSRTRKSNIQSIEVKVKQQPSPSTGKVSSTNSNLSQEELDRLEYLDRLKVQITKINETVIGAKRGGNPPQESTEGDWVADYIDYKRSTGMFT